jgi:GNAT superfamily N-acetyltransferase
MNSNNINDLLLERIADYLNPYLKKLRDSSIENENGKIEVTGTTDGKPTSLFVLIRIDIREEWKQIFISTLYLPDFMRHQGIGKQLVKVVYNAAKQLGYELFIAQMMDSFYERMRKRGALKCEKPDMVQIVDSTKLD